MLPRYSAGSRVTATIATNVLLCAALATSLEAQDRSRIWLGAGLGSAARTDDAGGLALMAELVYQTGVHQFTARVMGATSGLGTSDDEFGDIGVLYGRTAKRPWGHACISAGLALTGISTCPRRQSTDCTTLGVAVVAETAARLAPVVGLGVQGFANLNPKVVYGGFVLFLQLGWMP